MSVTPDSPSHPWSSDAGQLNYKGGVVGMMYLGGDSLIPNPRLADVVAMRLNHYEEVNPGRLAVELDDVAGVTTTRFARGDEDTGQFEWERALKEVEEESDRALAAEYGQTAAGLEDGAEPPITPPRAAPPGWDDPASDPLGDVLAEHDRIRNRPPTDE